MEIHENGNGRFAVFHDEIEADEHELEFIDCPRVCFGNYLNAYALPVIEGEPAAHQGKA